MRLMNEWERKGHQEGLEEGRKEGLEEGRKEGRKVGRKEGRQEQARRMLGIVLRSRLGEVPESLQRRLEAVAGQEALEALAERAATCDSLDEFLQALKELHPHR